MFIADRQGTAMVTYLASIREFIEPAPVCLQPATLAEVADLMRQYRADRLVLVNERQFPIGVVHAYRLLSHPESIESLIEALPTIDETLSFEQIKFDDAMRYWAVVDRSQQFLGLVDSFYLRSWAEFTRSATLPKLNKLSSESLWHHVKVEPYADDRTHSTQQASPIELNRLKQQVQVQIAELGYPKVASEEFRNYAASEQNSKATLMQFLEHLPLPLMLQTQTGKMIAQNKVWSEQLGDLVDPGWVQRDAATFLEYATPPPNLTLSENQSFSSAVLSKLCQIGSAPNTCICVCPLKNGQERILQFAKIP